MAAHHKLGQTAPRGCDNCVPVYHEEKSPILLSQDTLGSFDGAFNLTIGVWQMGAGLYAQELGLTILALLSCQMPLAVLVPITMQHRLVEGC